MPIAGCRDARKRARSGVWGACFVESRSSNELLRLFRQRNLFYWCLTNYRALHDVWSLILETSRNTTWLWGHAFALLFLKPYGVQRLMSVAESTVILKRGREAHPPFDYFSFIEHFRLKTLYSTFSDCKVFLWGGGKNTPTWCSQHFWVKVTELKFNIFFRKGALYHAHPLVFQRFCNISPSFDTTLDCDFFILTGVPLLLLTMPEYIGSPPPFNIANNSKKFAGGAQPPPPPFF